MVACAVQSMTSMSARTETPMAGRGQHGSLVSSRSVSARAARFAALGRSTRGAGMVEYIVIAAVVALAALAGYRTFGNVLERKVDDEGQHVTSLSAYNGGGGSVRPGPLPTPPGGGAPPPHSSAPTRGPASDAARWRCTASVFIGADERRGFDDSATDVDHAAASLCPADVDHAAASLFSTSALERRASADDRTAASADDRTAACASTSAAACA